MRRRLLLLVPASFVLTGCETLQDPEPISKTVPVATLIAGSWALVVVGAVGTVVRIVRRNRGSHLVRWPTWIAALAIAPALATGTALMGILSMSVAFAYQESHHSLFSWDEVVAFAAIIGGLFAVAVGISLGLVALLVSRSRRLLVSAQVLLVAPVAAGLLAALAGDPGAIGVAGWSTPWIPALIVSFWRAPPAEPDLIGLPIPGRSSMPSQPPVRC